MSALPAKVNSDWSDDRAECDFGWYNPKTKEEKNVTITGKQNVQTISVPVGSGDGEEA
jgi:hypothetical protein